MTLPQQIASKAESIVNSLVQTDYQHTELIDPSAGIYDCDCNGFAGFVLDDVAPAHYHLIPKETSQRRPRAFKYYGYFASLTPESTGGWHRIDFLRDTLRGDVIAWRFPTIERDENTGHVLFVAAPPTIDASGIYSVRVYDSAADRISTIRAGVARDSFRPGSARASSSSLLTVLAGRWRFCSRLRIRPSSLSCKSP